MFDAHASTDTRRLLKLAGVPLAAAAAIACWPEEDLRGAAVVVAVAEPGDADATLRRARNLIEADIPARIAKLGREDRAVINRPPRSPFGRDREERPEEDAAAAAIANAERAAAPVAPPPPLPVVTAVIATGAGGVAWIDGRRVTVGDEVGGHVVVAIDAAGVRVRPLPPEPPSPEPSSPEPSSPESSSPESSSDEPTPAE